ncbi:MAG: polyribonucleotide nucleotidyltransferase [Chloroflexi bacterium]|nr:polyribonucleotide nucleotidyltransferase [Chloroflexota bacterium]
MLQSRQFTAVVEGQTVTLETGKLAPQAGGAVTVRQGDTLLFAAATMSRQAREGIDFFPLTVDYEERLYAGGRIPGSFFRREGRPSEAAILTARLADRPLRPLFPKDLRNDVQVVLYSLSSDGEVPLDMLGIVGASAALTISDVPFGGPVAAVRIGRIDGKLIVNPTFQQIDQSDFDLRVAGTRDAILMVECGANEVAEDIMVAALEKAHQAMRPLIDVQDEMRAAVGKPKLSYTPHALSADAVTAVRSWAGSRLKDLHARPMTKVEVGEAVEALKAEAVAALAADGALEQAEVDAAIEDLHKEAVRSLILDDRRRVDGRGLTDLRPLSAEVDLSPRAHGSGLFQRGETQVLTLATLGTPRERQELDGLSPVNEKRYIHHYNFPPFSTGETRPLRGTSRRETGHGALAERALVPVLPPMEEFPYTMRLVSEVLSSNGSTSMASVCGSTLALLDTGVPIKAPEAGIAMGLVKEGDRYAVLTDIQGIEDHLGDMDFKVAGTQAGITALQMDIKIKGITPAIMAEALQQARAARLKILETIQACIAAPRPELKPHAPRLTVIKIDPDKIGAIIGPGGKTIRSIQEQTGATIDIEDDGSVFIAATNGESASKAREMVESLIEVPIVGRIYTGRVVRTTDFGAFVQILPGTDGMVHISQLDSERIEKVEDVAKVGDDLTVMVTAIDPEGKIRLSRQAVLEGWTPEEALERDRRPSRKPGEGGGRPGGSGGRGGSRDRHRS